MAEHVLSAVGARTDRISGTILVLLAGLVAWSAADFPALDGRHPGPALFPMLIAAGLGTSGAVLILRTLRARRVASNADAAGASRLIRAARLVGTIALVALYPVASETVGFVPTISLIAFFVGLILGVSWLRATATAVGASLVVYWLFTALLGVPL